MMEPYQTSPPLVENDFQPWCSTESVSHSRTMSSSGAQFVKHHQPRDERKKSSERRAFNILIPMSNMRERKDPQGPEQQACFPPQVPFPLLRVVVLRSSKVRKRRTALEFLSACLHAVRSYRLLSFMFRSDRDRQTQPKCQQMSRTGKSAQGAAVPVPVEIKSFKGVIKFSQLSVFAD